MRNNNVLKYLIIIDRVLPRLSFAGQENNAGGHPMQRLVKAADRGADHADWLETRYSFSFAGWHNPQRMGFRSLRVLNEDRIAPGAGFGAHPHRDMEILTIVLKGALAHEDSSGSTAVLQAGDVQRMSAGRGVVHSEWNASNDEALHLLQIWILPSDRGTAPSHDESSGLFPVDEDSPDGLLLLVAPSSTKAPLHIGQDAAIFSGRARADNRLMHTPESGRGANVQAGKGGLLVNGTPLEESDGLAVEDEPRMELTSDSSGDFLLFDLA